MNYLLPKSWAIAFMIATTIACSSDDSDNNSGTKPTSTPSGSNSTLTFSINSANGQGTTAQPFTASPDKPLNATLSQTVTYTDAQGQQQTVSPKATIAVTVKTDILHVADFTTLTKLTQSQPITDTKAGNPKTATRQQVFNVGGQEITFDLSHEIYSYTNGNNQQEDLPYIELKAPRYGAATPDKTNNTRSFQGFVSMPVTSVTAIRLTPLCPITRGSTINTTTNYDVCVSFTVDAETHNTDANTTHTLSTDVHYTAVVESTTEVPNASTSIAYQLNYHGGTSDTSSPFHFTAEKPLQLEWLADARCTYTAMEDLATHVVTLEPKASITVSAQSDIVRWDGDKEGLIAVSSTEPTITTYGGQPQVTDCIQTFTIGGQVVTINWAYEDYGSVVVEDTTVAMPYLQLGAPEVVEVTIAETAQSREVKSRLAGKTYTMSKGQTRVDGDSDIDNLQGGEVKYEVAVRFRQQLQSINTQEPVAETIEYVVTYIAEVGVKLIDTTYEKGYEWLEPWCDLPWRYNLIVWRVRTYSNGETEKDEFRVPTGLSAIADIMIDKRCDNNEFILEDIHFVYHDVHYDDNNDVLRCVATTKTGVPDISLLSWEIAIDTDDWNNRNFSNYHMEHSEELFNPTNPVDNWYGDGIARDRRIYVLYNAPGYSDEWARCEGPYINFCDDFLYLDGQIIDFPEYRMTYNFNVRVDNASFNGSPAKVFTHECRAKYLGKDFYAATVDTVYQIK